jgi:hypothetical protein
MANYFIKIEEGPEVRRKILESSKASLHVLKGYQQLLIVRGQKLTLMNDLRHELKELTVLLNRAETLMPQLSQQEIAELTPKPVPKPVPAAPVKPEPVKAKQGNRKVFVAAPVKKVITEAVPVQPAQEPQAPVVPPRMTELEKLEAALSEVEAKLGNL